MALPTFRQHIDGAQPPPSCVRSRSGPLCARAAGPPRRRDHDAGYHHRLRIGPGAFRRQSQRAERRRWGRGRGSRTLRNRQPCRQLREHDALSAPQVAVSPSGPAAAGTT
jgi:hypothetical protein